MRIFYCVMLHTRKGVESGINCVLLTSAKGVNISSLPTLIYGFVLKLRLYKYRYGQLKAIQFWQHMGNCHITRSPLTQLPHTESQTSTLCLLLVRALHFHLERLRMQANNST